MTSYEQRWLDDARRTGRCPECDAPARPGSRYCSRWCVDMAYRREIELPRERAEKERRGH